MKLISFNSNKLLVRIFLSNFRESTKAKFKQRKKNLQEREFCFFSDALLNDSDSDSRDSKTGFWVIQTLHANNNSLRNASYGVI